VARGSLEDLNGRFEEGDVRGEVVVVIGGAPGAATALDPEELAERVRSLTATGLSRMDAAARVAAEAGASRREVYEASLRHDH
jgi:16S rRNA (cytidine1402-2'-O)-methyltransferase